MAYERWEENWGKFAVFINAALGLDMTIDS